MLYYVKYGILCLNLSLFIVYLLVLLQKKSRSSYEKRDFHIV